jgi:cell division septation protein DedD
MAFGRRDNDQDDQVDDGYADDHGGALRWLPAAVVSVALVGFMVLAWYAYHSGTQSINEEDLMVVEADQSPMKEKPLDPGGMKFPNQDKTVFETFAGNSNPPKVERVMPAPEEPITRDLDTSETKTWINDKLKTDDTAQAAGQEVATSASQAAAPAADKEIVTHVANPTKVEPVEVKPVEVKPVEVKAAPAKPEPAPAAKAKAEKPAASGSAKVQLGAYSSDAEAKAAWKKLQAKFPELAGKTMQVVKADLGTKGVFYRLRAGGVADAKAFCARLSAKGQACLPVP